MTRKSFKKADLTETDLKVVYDSSIPVEMASFMLDIPEPYISSWRHAEKFAANRLAASQRYRDKKKAEGIMSQAHKTYQFWSEADVQYIMTSEDTDEEMAKKLGRTICSVQKKRERVLAKGGNDGA